MFNWLDVFLSYDFEIIHRPGILNVHPDVLSRLFPPVQRLIVTSSHQSDAVDLPVISGDDRRAAIENPHLHGHFGKRLPPKRPERTDSCTLSSGRILLPCVSPAHRL